ncbi:MAG: antitoxin Xre/MbcA/ParS toxin-binding domain-containing protein, partial [Burkholderiales bacterium]
VFDIESAQEAFEALRHLDYESTQARPADELERDADGAVRRAHISWKKRGNRMNRSWSNTVLGSIRIEQGRLTAEVNSDKRAAAFRKIVERALGERARFCLSEVQSAEKLMTQAKSGVPPQPGPDPRELADSPEVAAVLQEHLSRHYQSWVRQKIPALGGRTPLQAAKDPDGREMVEALLLDFERRNRDMPQPVDEAIFRKLRERLGLPAAP